MTAIQQQAIHLIQQLPDDKIMAIITLATDEINLMELKRRERVAEKEKAFDTLEKLELVLPDNFDADKELALALEKKYGNFD